MTYEEHLIISDINAHACPIFPLHSSMNTDLAMLSSVMYTIQSCILGHAIQMGIVEPGNASLTLGTVYVWRLDEA